MRNISERICLGRSVSLVLVVGMGLFVKYAIDKNWINELFRTVLGFVVGGGLLFLSQRLKKYIPYVQLPAGRWCICHLLCNGGDSLSLLWIVQSDGCFLSYWWY